MAELVKDPRGLELEDFVAAHFASRGCYVETGIKERKPDEILELDVFWNDYTQDPPRRHPVEVKSGDWGLGEVFKFYGWTRYLGLDPGQFIHKLPCGRIEPQSLDHISKRTGIVFFHLPELDQVDLCFKSLGLKDPCWKELPELLRFSLWAQRRLLKSLGIAIKKGSGQESAKAAKNYYHLINDSVFFVPDVRDRIGALFAAHFQHQHLALTAALEQQTGNVVFDSPPQSQVFKEAMFRGRHFPVQASLFLGHRARLYMLKALVDFWVARERGEIKDRYLRIGKLSIDLGTQPLSNSMITGLKELSQAKGFRMFPILWQMFLWSWGGFLLTDRLDKEYALLSEESGVPVEEVELALSAFDRLFPTQNGWFRQPPDDSRRVLILMPPALRGIGAARRKTHAQVEDYKDLGVTDATIWRLATDHNCAARLLECDEDELYT